jgi:RNA polymerase sigma-70 factor (ECF subfamily)
VAQTKTNHLHALPGPSDTALVLAARTGEKWAQEALFKRHARTVNGLAYRLLGRDEEVDDLVQEAFLAALRSLSRLENPQAFAAWLCSILVRTTHKTLRRRAMLTRLGLRRSTPIDPDVVVSRTAPPEVRSELEAIYGVLDRMRPEVRVALVLQRVEGLSVSEIAEQMGLSVSTVKRRLAMGEKRLEQYLRQNDAALDSETGGRP